MPVRTVSNRGRRNAVGYFPSLKMRRMVQFESTLERDLIYLLDFDRRVTAFEEQPLKIVYQHGESRVQANLHARFGEGALETQVKLCAGALLYKTPNLRWRLRKRTK